MGKPFEQEKYDRIVFASGLMPDIRMLPAGDQTEIGEKGINLSGGQKQRVSLARAAYQDADIYLLDDPLSAVDAHVDQHLWQHLIGPSGLLKDKTRILITHGIHHLENVDQIVVIKDGTISETGEYRELISAKDAFYRLITEYSVQEKNWQKGVDDPKDINTSADITFRGEGNSKDQKIVDASLKTSAIAIATGGLVSAEEMTEGKVRWRVYLNYAKAM
jgi:ATP-binding cassette subfamily C (CFTR/MRP) protein 1